MTNALEDKIRLKLEEVIDPELFISIVDLGLIYSIKINEGNAYITMTLTTLGCPLFYTIEKDIKEKLAEIEEIKGSHIELVFDPPWSMERLSEKAKALMGI
jgi:metal-sulfur cluster biosynthetic enzyme